MVFDIWYYGQQTDIGYSKMKKAFEAGQQSKQAEIDELQKQIDTALWHLEDHEGYDDLTHVIKILKGESK